MSPAKRWVAPQSIPAGTVFPASIALTIAAGYAAVGRRLQPLTDRLPSKES